MRLRLISLLAATVLAGTALTGPAVAATDPQWAKPGSSAVKVKILPAHTLYYPATLTGRRPIVVWGNGTGAVPGIYSGLLRHLASHGFIGAAGQPSQAVGCGPGSICWPGSMQSGCRHVDLEHIGAHRGMGALNAGVDARIDTTIPIQPGPLADPGSLKGPSLFLSGEKDTTVPAALVVAMWMKATQVPAVYGSLGGATHLEPSGDGGGYRGVVTAWFAYQLTGNARAAAEFTGPSCGLCTDGAWVDVRRNAKAG